MAVTKRVRFEVLRRDNYTCRYCGAKAETSPLTVDHVVPVSLGGGDDPSNLVAACADCNSGKTSTVPDQPLVAEVADDALRWAQAMNVAAAERAAAFEASCQVGNEFRALWDAWTIGGERVALPPGWRKSVNSLMAAGLSLHDFEELIEVAMGSRARDTWKYFCGCCWKRVQKSRARAAEIIAADLVDEPVGRSGQSDEAGPVIDVDEGRAVRKVFEPQVEFDGDAWQAWFDAAFGVGENFDQALFERWSAAQEAEEQARQTSTERCEVWGWFNMVWCEWENPRTTAPYDVPPHWIEVVTDALIDGLTRDSIEGLVLVAMESSRADKWGQFQSLLNRELFPSGG
ncbi:HNH endonuclease [Nocardia gipuzkoensis]